MKNEQAEKQWQEFVNRKSHLYSLEFKEIGEYENTKDVYLDAVDFVRANLSQVPEVRELIDLVSNAHQAGYFLNNEALNKGIKEALKNLEGGE